MKQTELRAHIKEAERTLEQMKRKVVRLEQYIAAGKRLLSKETADDESMPAPKRRRTRKNSLAERIKPILETAGRSLHVSEIVAQLQSGGFDLSKNKNPGATIAAALIRRPEDFERVGPNQFTLKGRAA